MMKYLLGVIGALIVSVTSHAQQHVYTVKSFSSGSIVVDGLVDESTWKKCNVLTTFVSPWTKDPIESTTFRAAYDNDYFYFVFEVNDNKIIFSDKKDELSATEADRIELFFSRDTSLNPYYCFEIAPNGLTCDYKAKYYRQFFREWNADGLRVKTAIDKTGYIVEGAIPLSLIKQIYGVTNLRGASIPTGVFRGDKDVNSSSDDDITWISWIRPKAQQPDFHIPSAFGSLKFE